MVAAIGFGIFTAVRALTPSGSEVGVASQQSDRYYMFEGKFPIYYGTYGSFQPWKTHWYGVDTDQDGNRDHYAMCLQASKESPPSTAEALKYYPTESKEARLIRIMLATVPSYSTASVTHDGPDYYNEFRAYYDWDTKTAGITNLRNRDTNIRYGTDDSRASFNSQNEEIVKYADYYYDCANFYSCSPKVSKISLTDAIFATGHMMASGLYANDYYGVSSQSSYIEAIADDIEAWFSNNYPEAHKKYQIYTSEVSDNSRQTVGWLEFKEGPGAIIKIRKADSVTGSVTNGSFTVQGAVFHLGVYTSPNTIYSVKSTTIDENGIGVFSGVKPGTYVIYEFSPTIGYKTDSNAEPTVTVTEDDTYEKTIDLSRDSTACSKDASFDISSTGCTFMNELIKGKVSFTKTGYELSADNQASSRDLAGISFTAVNKADPSINYTIGPTNFYGSVTSPDILYGEYTATEIRSDANAAYDLISFDFSITDTYTTSLGTKTDTISDQPSLSTVARNSDPAANPQNELEISTNVSVTDNITCSGLEANAEYKLDGTLWAKGISPTQVRISSTNSAFVTGTTTFTAGPNGECYSNGSPSIDMAFSTFDSIPYIGKTLSIKQTLYKNNGTTSNPDWVRIFIHNYNLDDPSEEVTVKSITIETVAKSERTGGQDSDKYLTAGKVKIKDTYVIEGLTNGQNYTITGTVTDANGNPIALIDSNGQNVSSITDNITMNLATGATYTATMDLTLDSTPHVGKTLYVHQSLKNSSGVELISHVGASDNGQFVTVLVPELSTNATSAVDGSKELYVGTANVQDTVTYKSLAPGSVYTIKGELWKLKADGTKDVKIADATDSFTASTENGTRTLSFPVNTVTNCAVNNKLTLPCKFVVFEYIYYGNSSTYFQKHEDVTDNKQIVSVKAPSITTVATDKQNNAKFLPVGTTNVVDKVTYSNLVPGQTYILRGRLIDLETGNVVKNGANEDVAAIESFVAAANSASITVDSFKNFDTVLHYDFTKGGNQKKFVVYQTLYSGDIELYSHADNTDNNQIVQINVPEIITSATYAADNSRVLGAGNVTMRDYIDYNGLVEGEWYTAVATIIDKATGQPLEANGEIIKGTKAFQAGSKGNGSAQVDINLNTVSLQGHTLVVYERLYRDENRHGDGRLIATHEDLNDESQTVTVKTVSIGTTASDKADGDNVLDHENNQTIVDEVHYEGLLMSEDYILYGYLYDKTNREPLKDENGNLITATAPIATSATVNSGNVNMEFNLDAYNLPGVEIVVFEYLFQGDTVPTKSDDSVDFDQVITKHDNENSPSQTVKVSMRVGTTAADSYDGDQKVGVGKIMVIDNFKYEGADLGRSYKVKGRLVYKTDIDDEHHAGDTVVSPVIMCTTDGENGNGIKGIKKGGDDGEEDGEGDEGGEEAEPARTCTRYWYDVTNEKTFYVGTRNDIGVQDDADEEYGKNGTVQLTFELDTRELIGKELVVFEELYLLDDEGHETLVAEHKELDDESQTIAVATPTIHTIASDKADGDKELANDADVTIVDQVEYTGLAAGTTYTLHGVLVDKNSGERISGGVTEVTWTFEPTRDAGVEELEFTIDTTGLSGKEIVAFETLYIDDAVDEDNWVAEHKDLTDDSQTVWVKVINPNTGLFTHSMEEAKMVNLYTAIAGMTITTVGIWVAYRYARHRKTHRF